MKIYEIMSHDFVFIGLKVVINTFKMNVNIVLKFVITNKLSNISAKTSRSSFDYLLAHMTKVDNGLNLVNL